MMKKILVLCMLLVAMFSFGTVASAEFAKAPVAYIVLDNTGKVTSEYFDVLKRQVKQAYRYPYYEFIDTLEPTEVASEVLATSGANTARLPQSILKEIAEKSNAKVVALLVVNRMDEIYMEPLFGGGMFWDNGPTRLVKVIAYADMYIYKLDEDKMLKNILRSVDTEEEPNFTPAEEVIKWKWRNLASKMENKPII